MILTIITKTTDESQTATDKPQMIHRQLQTNPAESFFESIYKTPFSESILFFKSSNEKFRPTFKETSPGFDAYSGLETLLDNKSGNFQFLANFSLVIKSLINGKANKYCCFYTMAY